MNITMATSVVSSLQSSVSLTFASLLPLMAIVIAVPLTFYGIRKVIALFPKR